MELLHSVILNIMQTHKAKDHKITREELRQEASQWYGQKVSDREMRQALEDLRASNPEGAYIVSSLSGGYFMAQSLFELDEYLRADESRIRAIAQRIRKQRQQAGIKGKQPTLFD